MNHHLGTRSAWTNYTRHSKKATKIKFRRLSTITFTIAILIRKIDAKDIEWIELKEDIVYRLSTPTENVVIKIFSNDYDYPLAEICGNIVATHLLQVIPFFVRTLDIGKRDDQVVIIMEYLQSDTETIDLESPVNLYNFFYQTAYALAELEKLCHLVHFDLRYDNIMVKMLPQPRDFLIMVFCVHLL